MIFQYTHAWIFEPSPHTGQLKTRTSRVAEAGDYVFIKGKACAPVRRYVSPLDKATELEHGRPVDAVYHASGATRYRVGNLYGIQSGRGKLAVGRIQVLRLTLERADAITDAEAVAEGFKDRRQFAETWAEIHGQRFEGALVWAITFAPAARTVKLF